MRSLQRAIDIALYLVLIVVLTASVGSAVAKRPVVFSVIRSYSMYPLMTRGDLVFVRSLSHDDPVRIGDIVLFRAEQGSLSSQGWVIHRVVDGNSASGFVTKGDHNETTDQEQGSVPIKREWIASRTLMIGSRPLKIPILGYVPLWMEQAKESTYLLPALVVVLAGLILSLELRRRRKRSRSSRLEKPMVYMSSGVIVAVMLAGTMLASSQKLILSYGVSPDQEETVAGSSFGTMLVGSKIEKPLATLTNKSFLPVVGVISTTDPQIAFSHRALLLKPGSKIDTTMMVSATTPGDYQSVIWVGMYLPVMPVRAIGWMTEHSFWLALIVVSLVPATPLLIYPLVDERMNRQVVLALRRTLRTSITRLSL